MKVGIDQLQPGMLLKGDVTDKSGRLLTRGETLLTQKHIHVFKTWGITHAEIRGEGDAPNPEPLARPALSPQALEYAVNKAQQLFIHNNREHPAVRE
ncbi:MAG: hypothetical protein AB1810_16265 [Pseudomonadota bacterium]